MSATLTRQQFEKACKAYINEYHNNSGLLALGGYPRGWAWKEYAVSFWALYSTVGLSKSSVNVLYWLHVTLSAIPAQICRGLLARAWTRSGCRIRRYR